MDMERLYDALDKAVESEELTEKEAREEWREAEANRSEDSFRDIN